MQPKSIKDQIAPVFVLLLLHVFNMVYGTAEERIGVNRSNNLRRRGPDSCSLIEQFSKDTASFSTCAITSGDNMCKRCITEITKLTDSYTKLVSDEITVSSSNIMKSNSHAADAANGGTANECMESVSSEESRQRFHDYYSHSRKVWYDNNCDNCFVESSQQLNADVSRFFTNSESFEECLESSSNSSQTACNQCKDQYNVVSVQFEKLEDDYRGSVCLDVQAVMMTYRSKWFSLGCISPLSYDIIVITIGFLVIFACVAMYVLSQRLSTRHHPEVMLQKRLFTVQRNSSVMASGSVTESSQILSSKRDNYAAIE